MEYVIHKSCRTIMIQSYNGPTWDSSGLRHLRQDTYKDKEYAEAIALILGTFNGVGFRVSPMPGQPKMTDLTEIERDCLVKNFMEYANTDTSFLYKLVRYYVATWTREDAQDRLGKEEKNTSI